MRGKSWRHKHESSLDERPAMTPVKNPSAYSPLLFLNSLGAGGLAISFYMYLMWMTPHPGSPIPSFASNLAALHSGDFLTQSIAFVALCGILIFAVTHVALLGWNVRRTRAWKKTVSYENLRKSNGETQLMALPLTYAMTVNVAFIVGAVFIPNVWENREFFFPLALAALAAIGYIGLKTYLDFLARVLTEGGFDCAKNNSLGQMISVFAFAMIGVGFSAVAAMSHEKIFMALGFLGAAFFVAVAAALGLIKLVLGFRAMMEYKADAETTPTLLVVIPILTVLGIAVYRLKMCLAHNFGGVAAPADLAVFFVAIFCLQIFFGLLGWLVMKRAKYIERWVNGPERSTGVYALICPGVALFVLGNFVVSAGLAKIGLVEPMSALYALLYAPLVYLQYATVRLFFKLNKKMLADN